MTANYGYGNQQNIAGVQDTQASARGRPMNLRAGRRPPPTNANVISNPFGQPAGASANNDTSAGLFDHPSEDNMFVSDGQGQHRSGGIEFAEDDGSEFVSDPLPDQAPPTRTQQRAAAPMRAAPVRPRVAVPPRRQQPIPNAGLFGQTETHQAQPANAHLFGGPVEQESEEQPLDSGHQTVQFEEVGFHDQQPSIHEGGIGHSDTHHQPVYSTPFGAGDGTQAPTPVSQPQTPTDYDNEPPLLEELGIKPEEIQKKFLAILTQRGFKDVSTYEDMAGAIFVLFLFGALLLLRGTYQFGNIYSAGATGCVCIFFMINLLTKKGAYVELYSTISILGYSLLPFCCLAIGSLFLELQNPVGIAFCLFIITWSTVTATRFFENSLDMRDQRYLIAYPIFLFYCVFLFLVLF